MDFWILLVFPLAVPLATSRTAAQSTPTTSSASNITDITTSTVFPISATTTVPFTTAALPFTTPTTTDQTNAIGQTTTTYYSNTPTTITSDLITSYPNTATTLPTASDLPNSTTPTTDLNSATGFLDSTTNQPIIISNSTILPSQPENTVVTTAPGGTTLITEGTTLTTVPGGTTVTTALEGTSLTPGISTVTTVPESTFISTEPDNTVLTTRSESTSIPVEETPETTNNPNTALVAATTDLTTTTFYLTNGQTTTMYDPITTSTTTSDLSNTTYYPNATTTTTNITYDPTTDLSDTTYSNITVTTDSINQTEYFSSTSITTDLTNGTDYPSTITTVDLITGTTDGSTPTSIPTYAPTDQTPTPPTTTAPNYTPDPTTPGPHTTHPLTTTTTTTTTPTAITSTTTAALTTATTPDTITPTTTAAAATTPTAVPTTTVVPTPTTAAAIPTTTTTAATTPDTITPTTTAAAAAAATTPTAVPTTTVVPTPTTAAAIPTTTATTTAATTPDTITPTTTAAAATTPTAVPTTTTTVVPTPTTAAIPTTTVVSITTAAATTTAAAIPTATTPDTITPTAVPTTTAAIPTTTAAPTTIAAIPTTTAATTTTAIPTTTAVPTPIPTAVSITTAAATTAALPTTITPTTTAVPTTTAATTTPAAVPTTTTPIPTTAATTIPTTTVSITTAAATTTAALPITSAAIPTTTITPTTTTTLVCNNGGISLNGVCSCPDEWTGETCSDANFCQEQKLDGFNFPRTPIGWFAYSVEICPKGMSGAGKPRASTRCSTKNGTPSFNRPPQVLQCDQTLSDIQQNLTSPADLETLASSTQILTSKPEELTAENVTAAAQIANTLLLSPNATESVRVAAVATVSQLLNASTLDNGEENSATQGLTVTLDQLSVNLSHILNTVQSQVVQPNLVVQSAQIPAADTQGVQFTSLSGKSGSFVDNRVQLNTNTSSVVVESGFVADALIYVRFPPAVRARQEPSNVSLGFVLYQNARFFRSRRYRGGRATIRVLSGSVRGQNCSVEPQQVEMLFRPMTPHGTSLHDFACVFWDYSLQDWSTDGCTKGNASDGVLRCFCNHTTNFAALWSFREEYEYADALDVISVVGLSFSILGLVVTIIHRVQEIVQRSSRGGQYNKNSKMAQLCICVSLLAFIITFLSGVGNSSRQSDGDVQVEANVIPDSDEQVERDSGSCSAVAALLHFFLLATFTWNGMYGTQLVLLVLTMRRTLPPHWTQVSLAVGWGVPAVVMAITLGATYRVDSPLGYRQEEFCWLAALDKTKQFDFGKPMFWGFLLPLGVILIYNIVLLVLASLTTCRTDPNLNSNNRSSWRKKFFTSFSLSVLLGLSWTLGYLVLVTTGTPHLVFSIVFCLCTTTQGFQIFVLFTARTPSFRAAVSRSVQHLSSVSIPLNNTKYRLWKTSGSKSSSERYTDLADGHSSTTLQRLSPSQ